MPIICWGNLAKAADDTQRIEQSIMGYVEGHDENPNAHMGADYSLGAHRLQTMLDHPYDSIKYYHVYDIHAERITAGGMVIKGNGPYISVQDGAGAERVKIYPEGIIVKEGKISVENDGNQEIIDGRGLRGGNIFYSSDRSKLDVQTVHANGLWYPINYMTAGIYLTRNTPVMVFGQINGETDADFVGATVTLQYPTGYFPGLPEEQTGWRIPHSITSPAGRWSLAFTHIIQLYVGFSTIRALIVGDAEGTSFKMFGGGTNSFGYVVLGNG